MKISFATRLKEAMELKHVKQVELVEKTKIGKSAISQYLSGQFEPKQKNIYKIATALDVNEAWLMGYDVPMEKTNKQLFSSITHVNCLQCSPPEQTHIKKYRVLDEHGKEAVNSILEVEHNRFLRLEQERLERARREKEKTINFPANVDAVDEESQTAEIKVYLQPAAAGIGNYLTDSDDYDLMVLPADEVPSRADFGVRISGDSMEPKISDDDIVWVKATPQVENGEIGIFVLNGDALCKKLHIDYDKRIIELVSLNSKYEPRRIDEYDDFRTVGKVLL